MTEEEGFSVFTHVLLTAPSERIAAVYRQQLRSLQLNLSQSYLRDTFIDCAADPAGKRVGSGGGTLNALEYLCRRKQHSGIGLSETRYDWLRDSRVLIIHSGGDSRRAPLYSLCGKAWTTINAITDDTDGDIATPVALLIKELSLFCRHLPLNSLVVASSDVMLDITIRDSGISGPSQFPANAVTVVTVPEQPSVAMNHGVLVANADDAVFSSLQQPYHCSIARSYLQKPSEDLMRLREALFQQNNKQMIHQSSTSITTQGQEYAMVDTGVVIFHGAGLESFCKLLDSTIFQHCCSPVDTDSTEARMALRVELYSDLLHAYSTTSASLENDHGFSAYCERLGIDYLSTESSKQLQSEDDLYLQSLHIIHQSMQQLPLYYLFASTGRFEHLGTSTEVLSLFKMAFPITDTANQRQQKMAAFASKYQLQQEVSSIRKCGDTRSILVNSCFDFEENNVNTIAYVEHSCISFHGQKPGDAMLSHLSPCIGQQLDVTDGLLLQQVYLKLQPAEQQYPQFCLLALHIHDDVKAHYQKPSSSLFKCCWKDFFEVSGINEEDIWPAVDLSERTLWNARLFPRCCYGDVSCNGIAVLLASANSKQESMMMQPTSRLTLMWFKYMPNMKILLRGERRVEFLQAIADWKAADRLSLSTLLREGAAEIMLQWRVFLSCAINDYKHISEVRNNSDSFEKVASVCCGFTAWRTYCNTLDITDEIALPQLLSMWLLRLVATLSASCIPPVQLQAFNELWQFCTLDCGNERVPQVLLQFLKSYLFLCNEDGLQLVLKNLKENVKVLPSETHSSFILLIAWLIAKSPFEGRLSSPGTIEMVDSISLNTSIDISSSETAQNSLQVMGVRFIRDILEMIMSCIAHAPPSSAEKIPGAPSMSATIEAKAQQLIAYHIDFTLRHHSCNRPTSSFLLNKSLIGTSEAILVEAPARIDLAGGWSDTPPICYEYGGAVLNVSVQLDGRYPVRCAAYFINTPHILLQSIPDAAAMDAAVELQSPIECKSWLDFCDLSHASSSVSLFKACFRALKIIDIHANNSGDERQIKEEAEFAAYLERHFGGGIALRCASDLPSGSGMGGSSIVAAAALKALAALCGVPISNNDELLHLVMVVEQLLTTGGGWQDQMGAIFGGFKIGQCTRGLPMNFTVDTLPVSDHFAELCEQRIALLYTGHQRLAKNTLMNALRSSAMTASGTKQYDKEEVSIDTKIVNNGSTVEQLICNALHGTEVLRSTVLTDEQQLEQLSEVLNEYWRLKKKMAKGSEPHHIQRLFRQLQDLTIGQSLCGAGAGGFAVLILRVGCTIEQLQQRIDQFLETAAQQHDQEIQQNATSFSLHHISIDFKGITTKYVKLPQDDTFCREIDQFLLPSRSCV